MAMDIRRPTSPSAWDLMERLMEQPWAQYSARSANGGSTGYQQVPLNAWETKDGFQVALMAPGSDPAAINITAVGGTLTVEGELKIETPEGANYLWREFGPTKFRRTIQLPDAINSEAVEAYYQNGLL